MTERMTDWPADDAPLAEWLRPASARLRNRREIGACSSSEAVHVPGTSPRTLRRKARAKRAAAE